MRNQKVKDLTYLSVIISIIIIMGTVPFLGFLPLGFISVTIIHIPVIVAILYFSDRPSIGTITGLAFGLISFILALLRPTQPLDPFFQNPLVSVLPRILFALLTAILYLKLKNRFKNEYTLNVVTAVIGTLIHSVLVLGSLVILYSDVVTEAGTPKAAIIAALTTLYTASIAEAVAAGLIAPPIVRALKSMNSKETNQINLED